MAACQHGHGKEWQEVLGVHSLDAVRTRVLWGKDDADCGPRPPVGTAAT
jgi:hypothetical protein